MIDFLREWPIVLIVVVFLGIAISNEISARRQVWRVGRDRRRDHREMIEMYIAFTDARNRAESSRRAQ